MTLAGQSAVTDRAGPSHLDTVLALLLALAAFSVYRIPALRLADTQAFEVLNLAFDWDPTYFVRYLAGDSGSAVHGINFKHPLWWVFRLTAQPFIALGYPAKSAAALSMALMGAASVAGVWVFLRRQRAPRPEAFLATLFFASSSTVVFTSIVPESYGWSNAALVLLWTLALARDPARPALWIGRLLAAVLVAGATISNLMQVVIVQGAGRLAAVGPRRALVQTLGFLAAVLLAVALVLVLTQPVDLWHALKQPLQTAKEVSWQRTFLGDKVGLVQLLTTYFAYSFVAPEFSSVPLSSSLTMQDFRSPSYAPWSAAALAIWLVFAALQAGWMLWRSPDRRWGWALLATVVANVAFHLDYQSRGSVYIYAAHLHFPIFALGTGALGFWAALGRWQRGLQLAVLAALVGLTAATSLVRVQQLVEHLQQTRVSPDAPEVKP